MKENKKYIKFGKKKMDLAMLTQNDEIQIVVTTNFETDSFIKVCYEYKCNWVSKIAEMLSTERESRNSVDRYGVCLKKQIKGHLALRKVGSFGKSILRILFFKSR